MTTTSPPAATRPGGGHPMHRHPAARAARFLAGAAGWSLLLASGTSMAAVALAGEGPLPVVLLAALAGWVTPVLVATVVLFALARLPRTAVAALAVLLAAAGWLRPFPHGNPAPSGSGPSLTVMAQNLLFGQADPDDLVAAVRRERPDVLVLTELTEQALVRLDAAGLAELMPHRMALPEPGPGGTGLFSTTPLTETAPVPGMHFRAVEAVTTIGGHRVRLLGVHPTPPQLPSWAADHAGLRRYLAGVLGAGGTVVVAGDFNATRYNGPFRHLLDAGLADAAAARLWAWQQPTWPAGRDAPGGIAGIAVPSVIRIDHVLLSRSVSVEHVGTLRVDGTDHLGVVARVRLPR